MEQNEIEEFCETFFSNPHNRLIMAMFAVHDKEMTVKEALDFARRKPDDILGDK